MQFRIVSDLHNEFACNTDHVPVQYRDDEDQLVLIIAGDLGVVKKQHTYLPLLTELAERHHHVVYLPGNHEHYHNSIMRTDDKVREAIDDLDNVTYVGIQGAERIIFGDVAVIAHPLYSDMHNMDPLVMLDVEQAMNDFRMIRTGTKSDPYKRKLEPKDYVSLFQQGKELIFSEVEKAHNEGYKTLVATHWAPSLYSTPERFKGSNINGAYASDLDNYIAKYQPEVMVHGHTHDSFDYKLLDTRIICNPQGYVRTTDYNTDYDSNLIVDL